MNYLKINEFARERHQEMLRSSKARAPRGVTEKRPSFVSRVSSGWHALTRRPLRKLFN